MRYPPAVRITPGASRVYRGFVLFTTLILIALGAEFIRASGSFGLKNGLFLGLILCASVALLRDAFAVSAPASGPLSYAQGLWFLQQNGEVIPGTLRVHLDLQSYLLVSFQPASAATNSAANSLTTLFLPTTQWFHLEAEQLPHPSRMPQWQAVRRAVLAQAEPSHEELVA